MKTRHTDLLKQSSKKMSSEQELADNICVMIEAYSRRTGFSIEQRKNIYQTHITSSEKFVAHAEKKLEEARSSFVQSGDMKELADAREILERVQNKKCMCWNCRLVRMYEFFDFERNESLNKTETIAK